VKIVAQIVRFIHVSVYGLMIVSRAGAGEPYLEDILPKGREKPSLFVIGNRVQLRGNVKIPNNVFLKIEPGGSIDTGANKVMIPHLEAGCYQIFSPEAKGEVSLGSSIVRVPQWWGAQEDDNLDDTAAFNKWAQSIGDNSTAIVPAGAYRLNGGIGIYASNVAISAHGAVFVQYSKDSVTVDLNNRAVPEEKGFVQNSVRWSGGRFQVSPDVKANNTNVGIRIRGITRGEVSAVFGTGFGRAFVEMNPRDGFYIRDCHGYDNNIHVLVEDFQKKLANPQICNIENCGWGIHGTAGVLIRGAANDFRVVRSYFVGSDSIVVRTGIPNFSGQAVMIKDCSFEGGKPDGFYIRTVGEKGRPLRNLVIRDNTMQLAKTKCIKVENVHGCFIDGNQFLSDMEGMIYIDDASKYIVLGYNNFLNINRVRQGIVHKNARTEISLPGYMSKNLLGK